MKSSIFRTRSRKEQQQGMALILAIGFLAILSILGAVVLQVVNRDIKPAGTFLPEHQAFFAADQTVEYALNRDIIINLVPNQTINIVDPTTSPPSGDLASGGKEHFKVILGCTEDDPRNCKGLNGETISSAAITDLGPNDLPANAAELYGDDFSANYYHVEVKTKAGAGTEANVNASIVRLFKRDDDTIYRTTGGG
jgi:hypothetical protein